MTIRILLAACCLALSSCGGDSSSDGNGCVCAEIFAPVCGEDGMTYPNRCHLECAGVGLAREGEC